MRLIIDGRETRRDGERRDEPPHFGRADVISSINLWAASNCHLVAHALSSASI